jgi:hypothetical protein
LRKKKKKKKNKNKPNKQMESEKKELAVEALEEHTSKKQKVEDTKTFGRGFYTKNFGPDSEVYSLIKQAKDKINQIYADNADDLEDCECICPEMAPYEEQLPGSIANRLRELMELLETHCSSLDKILEKHLNAQKK